MAAVQFSPIFNAFQGFTPAGLPLSGGLISTYIAGTSTPAITYTTSVGDVPNSNPIVLDSTGRTPAEVWLTAGQAYKFILADALSSSIATFDNIQGIQIAPSVLWAPSGVTPTFVNATQFTAPGNVVSTFPVGIRVQYTINTTQYTGSVSASSFSGGLTTVTIIPDSQNLTSGLNAVNVSQFTPQNGALPIPIPITFTPTWLGLTTPGTSVYAQQAGYGFLLYGFFFFNVTIKVTSSTGTGGAAIGGLPYAPSGTHVSAAFPIFNDTGVPLGARYSVGAGFFALANSTTSAAVSAGSPASNTYQLSGFFPVT